MGRKKNFEEEQLISFVREYISHIGFKHTISARKIADYINDKYNLECQVKEYNFRRNKTVNKIIKTYNKNVKESVVSTRGDVLCTDGIEVNRDNIRNESDIISLIKEHNELLRTNHELVQMVKDLQKENEKINEKTSYYRKEKESTEEETSRLKRENRDYARINQELREYIISYMAEPIMIKHFVDIKMIDSDKNITLPSAYHELLKSTDVTDLHEMIQNFERRKTGFIYNENEAPKEESEIEKQNETDKKETNVVSLDLFKRIKEL
jgi:hypothetical protein